MKIAIFGAGSTGCFLAGELKLAKLDVSVICRPRIKHSIIENNGIRLTDYQGLDQRVMPDALMTDINQSVNKSRNKSDNNSGDNEQITQFDVIFVTLKCHQLTSIIDDLLAISTQQSAIVLMQNGLGSLEILQQAFKNRNQVRQIFQGITPFNVLQQDNASFHKGTEGVFTFETCPQTHAIDTAMNKAQANISCTLATDMAAIINGKLLLNLNNALNAICDVPIKQQLSQRKTRKLLAMAMQEWLKVCKQAHLPLAQFTKVKPRLLPLILSLPDSLFTLIAKPMLAIDPHARSSMWQDIHAQRPTEIDYLNGAVVKLGLNHQVATPVNSAIVAGIKKLEQGKTISIDEIYRMIRA
ncbi:2-dehydropantoate 2-reductase [Shewanella sp. 5_MG-2023]|uniref:2-dehydropantoate 2-reductase n=1 Tax=Shewanella sp. 5_MG-2023 TaxID=3062656 RepID=UPI0026E4287A|nr:2-dehydropantoate 2-reductase [Shewanella sp. 5_MG-2023]MDO6640314.1 2-dehydropantoate 2-reductase [Shewanella sp. 5_MG-2023]